MDSNDRTSSNYDNDRIGVTREADLHNRSAAPTPHAAQQRRSRRPLGWLLPLLLLALVVGAIFWMMDRDSVTDRDDVVGTSGRAAGSAVGALEAGSTVNLARVRVTEVVGDRTFWVGDGDDRALVVIPEDGSGPGTPETRKRFARGEYVRVAGRVSSETYEPKGLDEADRRAVAEADERVIVASRVEQLTNEG